MGCGAPVGCSRAGCKTGSLVCGCRGVETGGAGVQGKQQAHQAASPQVPCRCMAAPASTPVRKTLALAALRRHAQHTRCPPLSSIHDPAPMSFKSCLETQRPAALTKPKCTGMAASTDPAPTTPAPTILWRCFVMSRWRKKGSSWGSAITYSIRRRGGGHHWRRAALESLPPPQGSHSPQQPVASHCAAVRLQTAQHYAEQLSVGDAGDPHHASLPSDRRCPQLPPPQLQQQQAAVGRWAAGGAGGGQHAVALLCRCPPIAAP